MYYLPSKEQKFTSLLKKKRQSAADRTSTTTIALKQIGFVAGGAQSFAGASLCVGSADFVYGGVDILLSGYGATRKKLTPREKSWSLFQNIRTDYIRGWQEASKTSLALDFTSSSITGWQMYQLAKKNKPSKENQL
ncbi:DUF4225 domain-containing protein [Jejubacter sp. L23]|uniref:DUF4225 domain-containing protein n=1 Tax=Jejubacter sp. L23 TaxID=3092086 RepID=UPI003D7440F9